MKLIIIYLSIVFTLIAPALSATTAEDHLKSAQTAEVAGRNREALTHYLEAFRILENNKKHEESHKLRLKMLKIGKTLDPQPALPDEAIRHEGRAEAAVKLAKSEQDFIEGAKEYDHASWWAPWVPQYFYNAGVVHEKGGNFAGAIWNFNCYLVAVVGTDEETATKKKIAELEFIIEKQKRDRESEAAAKAKAEAEAKALALEKSRILLSSLKGNWGWGGSPNRYEHTQAYARVDGDTLIIQGLSHPGPRGKERVFYDNFKLKLTGNKITGTRHPYYYYCPGTVVNVTGEYNTEQNEIHLYFKFVDPNTCAVENTNTEHWFLAR